MGELLHVGLDIGSTTVKIVILNKDLEINSPYNTYKNPGLPPGPICIPGFASWAAAFDPEANKYFYYVAGRDGHHYFAKNYNDHLKNIRQVKLDK